MSPDPAQEAYEAKLKALATSDAVIDTLLESLADLKEAIVEYREAEAARLKAINAEHRTSPLRTRDLLFKSLGERHGRLATALAKLTADPNIGERTDLEHRINERQNAKTKTKVRWERVDKSPSIDRGQLLRHPDDHQRWLLRVYLGRDGQDIKRYAGRVVRGTKHEAELVLTNMLQDADDGILKARSKHMKFGQYLREWWLPDKKKSVANNTWHSYKWAVEKFIIPALGMRSMSVLTTRQLDRFYYALRQGRYSDGRQGRSVVNTIHTVIRQALSQAVREGFVRYNVAYDADPFGEEAA